MSQLGVRRRIISEGGVARRYTGASSSQRVSHGGRERPLWRRDERAAPLWKTCHVQYFLDAQTTALMIAKLRRAAAAYIKVYHKGFWFNEFIDHRDPRFQTLSSADECCGGCNLR